MQMPYMFGERKSERDVKTDINVSISVKIGSNSWIEAEVLVKRDVKREVLSGTNL